MPSTIFADLQIQVGKGNDVIGFLGVVQSDGGFDGIKGQEGDSHFKHLLFTSTTDFVVLG
jgi:hypothetical protein